MVRSSTCTSNDLTVRSLDHLPLTKTRWDLILFLGGHRHLLVPTHSFISRVLYPEFLCLRSNKKSHNHGISDLRSPRLISFVISAFQLILSNALLKSSKKPVVSIRQRLVWITRNEICQVGTEW